jgi:hypothetical protein
MKLAKAHSRHAVFSGALRPRKSTSEKSTQSDPRPARRLKWKSKALAGRQRFVVRKTSDRRCLSFFAKRLCADYMY